MRDESSEVVTPLRSGYTTGSCATATALAAAQWLVTGRAIDLIEIVLPKGKTVVMRLLYCRPDGDGAVAAVIKDAGDDPDVTHGAVVFTHVALRVAPGIQFVAGPGVGTVTRAGLLLDVGEPAINPVPRQMITTHLQLLAKRADYQGGFVVSIGIEDGESLALKTMNPRLGIVGGLSILGTTGIVRPFSCSAYIASIHQGIDVARANAQHHLAACTGNASEDTIRARYGLPDMALIEMGDFVGAVLKHMRRAPVSKLTICGGFGKLSKLAAGHLDLHSRHSSIDLPLLAQWAGEAGADETLRQAIIGANTSQQALAMARAAHIPLGNLVCQKALDVARETAQPSDRSIALPRSRSDDEEAAYRGVDQRPLADNHPRPVQGPDDLNAYAAYAADRAGSTVARVSIEILAIDRHGSIVGEAA